MKILVCIKQVPEFKHMDIEEGPDGVVGLDLFTDFKMNRFDEFAVETAIQLKEKRAADQTGNGADTEVHVLTVGPMRAADVLKRGIGMGAHHGIHIQTETDDFLSPSDIAAWIAAYASPMDYDLILTGSMSEDGMNGQVGPMLAGRMNLPCATQVITCRMAAADGPVYVEREIEGGHREMAEIALPAVLAIQTGANRPRYPSLSNLLRAGRQTFDTIEPESLAAARANEVLEGFVMPRKTRAGRHLTGSPEEQAEQLIALLQEKAFI
ncbi:MAG: electron transfer flavoprotein subunit beta/FixA family protein [Thermodesulfobacteriota bacterium]